MVVGFNPRLFAFIENQKIELSGHEAAEPVEHTYTVEPGDTVSGLAEKFGLRSIDIAAVNKLDNINHIEVGQELTIAATGVARRPADD